MSYADYWTNPPARELTGKRVGMIGFGHIAWRLRELLVPFEVSILAYDPYVPRELADALCVDLTALDTVMGCDVVICLAPATPETTGMIGARELALLPGMPPSSMSPVRWWSTSSRWSPRPNVRTRGSASTSTIRSRFAIDSPLIGLRNVFLSPHIGGNAAESLPRFFGLMVDEVERYFGGLEPRAQITDRVVAGPGGHLSTTDG